MSSWKLDPATNRQKKVLKFFDCFEPEFNKGQASVEIFKIFRNEKFREHWNRYLFLTEDFGSDDDEIRKFDYETVAMTVVPEGWVPEHRKSQPGRKFRDIENVLDILKEGVPFDDPVPEIIFRNKRFCLTGTFSSGKRIECEAQVTAKGGFCSSKPSSLTDYLVVGGVPTKSWSSEKFGNKIIDGLAHKLGGSKLAIVTEQSWINASEH